MARTGSWPARAWTGIVLGWLKSAGVENNEEGEWGCMPGFQVCPRQQVVRGRRSGGAKSYRGAEKCAGAFEKRGDWCATRGGPAAAQGVVAYRCVNGHS